MDEIIKQFKIKFKAEFKAECSDSLITSLVERELKDRMELLITNELLGRTTEDLLEIEKLLLNSKKNKKH